MNQCNEKAHRRNVENGCQSLGFPWCRFSSPGWGIALSFLSVPASGREVRVKRNIATKVTVGSHRHMYDGYAKQSRQARSASAARLLSGRHQVRGETIMRPSCFRVMIPETPVCVVWAVSDFLLTSPYNHGTVGSSQNLSRGMDRMETGWPTADLQEKKTVR